MYLIKESIYIINNNSVSYSIINNTTESEFMFNCNIDNNSYCYPIFNLRTNKLIGIYEKDYIYYHRGVLFKHIIRKLESKYKKIGVIDGNNNINEIKI